MNLCAITNGSDNRWYTNNNNGRRTEWKKGLEMVKFYSNQKHGLEIIRILSFDGNF